MFRLNASDFCPEDCSIQSKRWQSFPISKLYQRTLFSSVYFVQSFQRCGNFLRAATEQGCHLIAEIRYFLLKSHNSVKKYKHRTENVLSYSWLKCTCMHPCMCQIDIDFSPTDTTPHSVHQFRGQRHMWEQIHQHRATYPWAKWGDLWQQWGRNRRVCGSKCWREEAKTQCPKVCSPEETDGADWASSRDQRPHAGELGHMSTM